jgi:hypothetical protein
MAVDERSRQALYAKLQEVLGAEEATTLIEYLPPVGWSDVATKRDLDNLAVATKRDLDNVAVATKRDLAELAAANRHEHEQLALSWRLELESTTTDLRREIHSEIRSLMIFMSSLFVALAGVAFAAARLT